MIQRQTLVQDEKQQEQYEASDEVEMQKKQQDAAAGKTVCDWCAAWSMMTWSISRI